MATMGLKHSVYVKIYAAECLFFVQEGGPKSEFAGLAIPEHQAKKAEAEFGKSAPQPIFFSNTRDGSTGFAHACQSH